MQIEYLNYIQQHSNDFNDPDNPPNRGFTIAEIEQLRIDYNNGNPFPKVYEEFLFLAGKYAWFLWGWFGPKSMKQGMEDMMGYCEIVETRPFMPFNSNGGAEESYFIYLDEGVDDPMVYRMNLSGPPGSSEFRDDDPLLENLGESLSEFLIECLDWKMNPNNPHINRG